MLPEKTPAKPKPKPETKTDTAKAAPAEAGVSYVLQAASFATFNEADQLKAKLALSGLSAQIQKVTIEGQGERYRVRLGPFGKIEELDGAAQQLGKLGLKPLRLKVKKKAPDAVQLFQLPKQNGLHLLYRSTVRFAHVSACSFDETPGGRVCCYDSTYL